MLLSLRKGRVSYKIITNYPFQTIGCAGFSVPSVDCVTLFSLLCPISLPSSRSPAPPRPSRGLEAILQVWSEARDPSCRLSNQCNECRQYCRLIPDYSIECWRIVGTGRTLGLMQHRSLQQPQADQVPPHRRLSHSLTL